MGFHSGIVLTSQQSRQALGISKHSYQRGGLCTGHTLTIGTIEFVERVEA